VRVEAAVFLSARFITRADLASIALRAASACAVPTSSGRILLNIVLHTFELRKGRGARGTREPPDLRLDDDRLVREDLRHDARGEVSGSIGRSFSHSSRIRSFDASSLKRLLVDRAFARSWQHLKHRVVSALPFVGCSYAATKHGVSPQQSAAASARLHGSTLRRARAHPHAIPTEQSTEPSSSTLEGADPRLWRSSARSSGDFAARVVPQVFANKPIIIAAEDLRSRGTRAPLPFPELEGVDTMSRDAPGARRHGARPEAAEAAIMLIRHAVNDLARQKDGGLDAHEKTRTQGVFPQKNATAGSLALRGARTEF